MKKPFFLSSEDEIKSGAKKTYIVRSECLSGLKFGDVVCQEFLRVRIFHIYGIDLPWEDIEATYPEWFVNYFLYLSPIVPVKFPLDRLRHQDHEQETTIRV